MYDDNLKIYVTSYSDEVTGSNNHVTVKWPDKRSVSFIVDCGLFQEEEHKDRNGEVFLYKPEGVAFAIATHVHTDHVGRLPKLVKEGFTGKIYLTADTLKLLPIVLTESYERLEEEYRKDIKEYKEYKQKIKNIRLSKKGRGRKDKPRHEKGSKETENSVVKIKFPTLIYDKQDIDTVIKQSEPISINTTFSPCPGIEVTFYPNAHIAGAVITVCRIFSDTEEIYMLFTGDLGLYNPVTGVDTTVPYDIASKIDIIISESTYGAAEESKNEEKQRQKHMEIIKEAYNKNGTIVYMSNALERPLRLGADLKTMQSESQMSAYMEKFNIFMDTTFGVKCLNKYIKMYGNDFLPDNFTVLDRFTRDTAKSMQGPNMFIVTSPRLFKGSFLNYGAEYLEDPNVTLVFVAYVPEEISNIIALPIGSEMQFDNQDIKLRCKRCKLGYYSSHVSTEEMNLFMSWFPNAKTILFNHGTNDAKANFAERYKTPYNTTNILLYGRTVMVTSDGVKQYF